MSEDRIIIEQSLHGYSNGHKLLESSVEIPPSGKITMLALSDLSGPSISTGFESYLTGYPIKGTEAYAIAKTWYAPELPRPGCVWTHSLIIQNHELSKIRNEIELLRLFRRPTENDDLASYKTSIEFSIALHQLDPLPGTDASILNSKFFVELFRTFFLFPEKQIVIMATNSSIAEDSILRLWCYLWPYAKQNLTFCTGALNPRYLDDTPFAIQVFPFTSTGRMERELPDAVVLGYSGESRVRAELGNKPYEDLISSQAFKHFLHEVTVDLKKGREVIQVLLDAFMYVDRGGIQFDDLTRRLCKEFPSPSDAAALKRRVYGISLDWPDAESRNETDLIGGLVTTSNYACLDRNDLKLQERGSRLWKRHRSEAIDFLSQLKLKNYNELVYDLLFGIATAIQPLELPLLSSRNKNVVPLLVELNPRLAESPNIWEQPIDVQREVLDNLLAVRGNQTINWNEIVHNMLTAGKHSLVEETVQKVGGESIDYVFGWLELNEPTPERVTKDLIELIQRNQHDFLSRVNSRNSYIMNVLSWGALILDPNSEGFDRNALDKWGILAKKIDELSSGLTLSIKSFLLALGLENPRKGAEELVSVSFEAIHASLAVDSLPYARWKIIEPHVPHLGFGRDWDKCKRLRKAFIRDMIAYNWPLEAFLNAVKDPYSFREIIKALEKKPEGAIFLDELVQKVRRAKLKVTDIQKEILMETYGP